MTSELFAIVKWLNDEDKGTYTVGVPTQWIIQFDYQEYCMNSCDADESYVVEWRQGKKPAGGWLCYDAVVTDVSKSIAALEKKFKNNYKCIKSPRLGGCSGNQKSFMDGSAAGSTSNFTNATSITTDKNANKKTSLKRPHSNKDDDNDIERTPLNNSSPVRPRNLFGSNNGENDIVIQLLTEMRNMQENMRNIRPIPRAAEISELLTSKVDYLEKECKNTKITIAGLDFSTNDHIT
ncbi:Protein of unknown function, partial [Cotesia congregata]